MSSTQQSNVLFITLPWGPAWTLHCPVLPVPRSFYCMPMFVWVMLWGKELLVFTDLWTNLATLDRSFLENPDGTVCWITPLSSWSSVWLCQRPLRDIPEVIWTELSRNQTYAWNKLEKQIFITLSFVVIKVCHWAHPKLFSKAVRYFELKALSRLANCLNSAVHFSFLCGSYIK